MGLSADEKRALYECLKSKYNLNELKELAFLLDIQDKNFDPHLDAFCRALIGFVVRDGRVPDLLRAMEARRHVCPALDPLFARAASGGAAPRALELAYLQARRDAPDHFTGPSATCALPGAGSTSAGTRISTRL